MKRGWIVMLFVALAAAIAAAATTLTQPVQNTLTTIDSVPSKKQLDHVFSDDALARLSTIAQNGTEDTGIRLRAIHALAKYCPEPCGTGELAHDSLFGLITDLRDETSGSSVLLLRAAIESIGALHVADDMNLLIGPSVASLLDHQSRDVRTATARALRDLCNTSAITPLRVRYTSESTEQVKLAISDALRVLGQCSAAP
jgi:HEAT repeat protein